MEYGTGECGGNRSPGEARGPCRRGKPALFSGRAVGYNTLAGVCDDQVVFDDRVVCDDQVVLDDRVVRDGRGPGLGEMIVP